VKVFTRLNDDGSRERSAAGTRIGRILVGGESINIPAPGESITIPGVAEITFKTYRRLSNGLDVTGLRIELLDGQGTIVELGRAKAIID